MNEPVDVPSLSFESFSSSTELSEDSVDLSLPSWLSTMLSTLLRCPGACGTANTLSKDTSPDAMLNGFGPNRGYRKTKSTKII